MAEASRDHARFRALAEERFGLEVRLARILEALISAKGAWVPAAELDELVMASKSHRRGGEPRERVSTSVCYLRRALGRHGFEPDVVVGRKQGYRVEPADGAEIYCRVMGGAP